MADSQEKEVRIEKILTTWGVIVILWSFYRANFHNLSLWFSEFIAKPAIFILPIYYCLKYQLNLNVGSGLGLKSKKMFSELLFAFCFLLLIIGFGLLITFTSKGSLLTKSSNWRPPYLLGLFFLSLATAVSEEIVGRGFLFNQLLQVTGKFVSSFFLAAILFFILYLPTILAAKVSGNILFMNLLLNFLLSFMSSLLFYLRKNIWLPIFYHAGVIFLFSLMLS